MSQREAAKTTIDGDSYELYMLSPRISRRLLTDVIRMILPAVGPVMDAFAGSGSLEKLLDTDLSDLEGDFFSAAATSLADRLDNDLQDRLFDTMAEVCHVDGKPLKGIFDVHFLGRLDAMYQWLFWSMKIQWGPTWRVLASTSQGAKVIGMASKSQSI